MSQLPPLFQAIEDNDLDGVRAALDAGADLTEVCHGRQALHLAAFFDQPEVVQLLLDHGADPDAASQLFGLRALHNAARRRSWRAFEVLVAAGADLLLVNEGGQQLPVDDVLDHVDTVERLRGLLALGGPAALAAAKRKVLRALRNRVELATWLMEQGAQVDGQGEAMLQAAYNSGGDKVAALEWVLAHGGSAKGTDLLARYAEEPDPEVAMGCVRLLLEQGADLHSTPFGGWTALAAAVHAEHEALAGQLLDWGADPYRPVDTDYWDYDPRTTPEQMARNLGFTQLVAKMAEAGAPGFQRVDHPGLHAHRCYASLIQGRSVEVRVNDPSSVSAETLDEAVAWVAKVATRLGVAWVARVSNYPSYDTEAQVYGQLTVGILIGEATDDEGPCTVTVDVAAAGRDLKRVSRSLWAELDQRTGLSFAGQRSRAWLVPSGPLASACLAYGVHAGPEDHPKTRTLSYWEGSGVGQVPHGWGVYGVVEGAEGARAVNLSKPAHNKRMAGMPDDKASYWLIAAYD